MDGNLTHISIHIFALTIRGITVDKSMYFEGFLKNYFGNGDDTNGYDVTTDLE